MNAIVMRGSRSVFKELIDYIDLQLQFINVHVSRTIQLHETFNNCGKSQTKCNYVFRNDLSYLQHMKQIWMLFYTFITSSEAKGLKVMSVKPERRTLERALKFK